MYVRRLGGFWSTMVHGSLDAGKVAVAGSAGGPYAAAGAAAVEVAGAAKGSPKAGSGQQASSGGANWLESLSNTQLALVGITSLALVAALGGRR